MLRRIAGAGLALGALAAVVDARAADGDATVDLGGVTLDLRRVPKGTFRQGSPPSEPGREPEETAHQVTLTRAYWLGRSPVTRKQFERFVTDAGFVTAAERRGGAGWNGKALVQKRGFCWRDPGFAQTDDNPVVLVTFADAVAFTEWASRRSGHVVRLPTEAEWERAARAGTTTPWYGGAAVDEALTLGWFKPNAANGTRPVGQKRPNAFGLFDMSGNVHEWCRDVYAPYASSAATDPEVARGRDDRRILRGGSWLRPPARGRSAARTRSPPGRRSAEYGFRVAVDDDPTLAPRVAPSLDVTPSAPAAPGPDGGPSAPPLPGASPGASPRASGGSGWALLAAPAVGAAAAVAWVLARRRARGGPRA